MDWPGIQLQEVQEQGFVAKAIFSAQYQVTSHHVFKLPFQLIIKNSYFI